MLSVYNSGNRHRFCGLCHWYYGIVLHNLFHVLTKSEDVSQLKFACFTAWLSALRTGRHLGLKFWYVKVWARWKGLVRLHFSPLFPTKKLDRVLLQKSQMVEERLSKNK